MLLCISMYVCIAIVCITLVRMNSSGRLSEDQSIDQSVNQSMNQSVMQLINQSS